MIVLPRLPRYTLISIVVALIVIAALVPSYYFYTKYQQSQKFLRNPSEAASEEMHILLDQVGRMIELPTGEQPTIATVADKTKLQNQPFFARSENGDKVLIFQQSKKAILFRPSLGKVIEVSTLNVNDAGVSSPAAAPTGVAPTSISVVLYNGTGTVGLTASVEKKLQSDPELGSKFTVVAKENAVKKKYTKTIVVVFTPLFSTEAQKLAKLLGGSVGVLPEGEVRPSADMAVIIGQ